MPKNLSLGSKPVCAFLTPVRDCTLLLLECVVLKYSGECVSPRFYFLLGRVSATAVLPIWILAAGFSYSYSMDRTPTFKGPRALSGPYRRNRRTHSQHRGRRNTSGLRWGASTDGRRQTCNHITARRGRNGHRRGPDTGGSSTGYFA